MRHRSLISAGLAIALLSPTLALAADVPAGVRIPARLTKDVKDEDVAVTYTITEDVKDGSGNILIPKGSVGEGKVIQHKGSAGFGGPGKTEISLDTVTLPDGKKLTVESKATKYGADSRFASIFFLGLWGYFSKGGSGKVGSSNTLTFVAK